MIGVKEAPLIYRIFLFSFFILLGLQAQALDQIGSVDTIAANKQAAIVKANADLDPNTKQIYLGTADNYCPAKVNKAKGARAIVSLAQCQKQDIKVGSLAFVKSADDGEESPGKDNSTPKATGSHKFSNSNRTLMAGLVVGLGGTLNFSALNFNILGTNYSGTGGFGIGTIFGADFLALYASPGSFGWGWGATVVDVPFNNTTSTVPALAINQTSNLSGSAIDFFPTIQGVYRLGEKIFIYAGLNYSVISYSNAGAFLAAQSGSIGGQAGASYNLTDSINLGLSIKAMGLAPGSASGTGVTITNSTATYLMAYYLSASYIF